MTRKTREAAVFVYRGDRFLIMRRVSDRHWNVVAGQVEDGESFAEGAARELAEEAQLAVPLIDLELSGSYEIESQFRSLYAPGEHTVTVAAFAAEAPPAWEPVLNHEHDIFRWCTAPEAKDLLHWPEMKAALGVLTARLGL